MPTSGNTVADKVREIVSPVAEGLGLTVWDIDFYKEGADHILSVLIDKDGGVGIEDCEALTRAIDKPLDDADPISVSYSLEVSSCGVERKLRTKRHFTLMTGKQIDVRLFKAQDGIKSFSGVLAFSDDDGFTVNCGDKNFTVAYKEASDVREHFDFNGCLAEN